MARCACNRTRLVESKAARGPLRNCLDAVSNQQEYIQRLKLTVEHLHELLCRASFNRACPCTIPGANVGQGGVEVFELRGHPKAARSYAWSHTQSKDDSGKRFVAVLE